MKSHHQQLYNLISKHPIEGNAFYRPLSKQEQGAVICEFRIYHRRSNVNNINNSNNFDSNNNLIYSPDSSLHTQQLYPTKHPDVDIVRLKSIFQGRTDISNIPHDQIWIVRCWGRGTGRKFIEPQKDGTLWHFKDMEMEPNRIDSSWNEFLQTNSPAVFFAFIFKRRFEPKVSNNNTKNIDNTNNINSFRTEFRKNWLQEWKNMEPHSFDPRNSIHMNLYIKKHCIPILYNILKK